MIDIMTILVFFLLVHGGFVRLAILELNLPTANSTPSGAAAAVPARRSRCASSASRSAIARSGLLNKIEKDGDKDPYDYAAAHRVPRRSSSSSFPQKTDATLLLEPDIPYDVLVSVMDHVRVTERRARRTGRVQRMDLFPDISIGDAPVLN